MKFFVVKFKFSLEECLKSEISELRTDAALAYAEAAIVA